MSLKYTELYKIGDLIKLKSSFESKSLGFITHISNDVTFPLPLYGIKWIINPRSNHWQGMYYDEDSLEKIS